MKLQKFYRFLLERRCKVPFKNKYKPVSEIKKQDKSMNHFICTSESIM